MLVIGSRALAHSFPDARAPLDWDLVGTREELTQLRLRLPPLPGVRDKADKAFFLHDGAPLEFVLAEDNEWSEVCKREAGSASTHPVLGALRFASIHTQLLLKLAHVHLPRNWDKTSADVAFLRRRGAQSLMHDPLLDLLRKRTERRIGPRECGFAEDDRLRPNAAGNQGLLRARLHHALGNRITSYADPTRSWRARRLPSGAADAKALLAELVMVHAVTDLLLDRASPTREQELHAVRTIACALCTRWLGRSVRLALAAYAHEVIEEIPAGFSHALLRAARGSALLTTTGTSASTRQGLLSRDAQILSRFGL